MRVFREGNALGRIVEQARESAPHIVRLLEREIPHVVDVLGRIEPRLLLCLERNVGPCLVRVTREENAFGNTKARVVLGELFRIDHSSERIAQRSGNAG